MEKISEKLRDLCENNPSLIASEFAKFLKEYTEPSFGSISKRDIEIKIFNIMRNLKLISKNPEIWEVISNLKVSNAKARNLIYNANMLREGEFENLDDLLKDVLKDVPYLKDGNYVLIQIDNPLLIDHIKYILKKEGCLSDGSFAADIVRMKPESFMSLYISYLDEKQREKLSKKLNKSKNAKTARDLALELIDEMKDFSLTTMGILSFSLGAFKKFITIKNSSGDCVDEFFKWLDGEKERLKKEKENKKETDS